MLRNNQQTLTAEALAKLPNMLLRARVMVEGHFSGQHRSRMRGASVEFADHREYVPGDDTRHLDWRLYARSERDFVKEFDAETNLFVYLILDTSASMNYPTVGISKLRYASFLAAGLAYLAWRQRDAPGLLLVDAAVRQMVPPRTQRGHLSRLLELLDELTPGGETNLPAALRQASAVMARRGLVVLVSDMWAEPDEIIRSLRYFRRRGHDVVALHVLHRDELLLPFAGGYTFTDPESGRRVTADAALVRGAYREAVGEHIRQLRGGLMRHDIDYELCDMSRPFDAALARFVARRTKMR